MESKPRRISTAVLAVLATTLGLCAVLEGCGSAVGGGASSAADAPAGPDGENTVDPGGADDPGTPDTRAEGLGRGGEPGPPTAAPGDALFAAGLVAIDIDVPPFGLAMLEVEPERYVQATVRIDGDLLTGVGVRLKGGWGSFRTLEAKAAFVLKFDEFNENARYDGLDKLALNNMVQDASMLHEQTAYAFFRDLGLPASRTTYARVRVNGEPYGLYCAVEVPGAEESLSRWFDDPAGTLYEGEYGLDLYFDQVHAFDQDAGADKSRVDLYQLTQALDAVEAIDDPELRHVALDDVVDLDRFLTFAAAEVLLGHWDGYIWGRNNYFVYHEPNGRWTFLPWGMDQTFQSTRDLWRSEARVQRICLGTSPCRRHYGERLGQVADAAVELGLRQRIVEARALVLDQAPQDPRKEVSDERVAEAIQETLDFLESWPGWVAANLACAEPELVDEDGDGVSGCLDDCDDTEAEVHPGAPELCNLRDDDCDGIWDNADECPSCLAAQDQAGQPLELCFVARSWPDARTDCQARGGDLVSVHGPAAQETLLTLAYDVMVQSWWIGLNDRDDEGTFGWSDGSQVDYTWWAGGEPNDAGGGEDCAHFAVWAGGRWNDMPCHAELPYVCATAE